jgi:leucyl/phenylalanyl-tRNA--protein transferase
VPVYALNKEIIFPDPNLADEQGLLAIGGDLTPERLILAYANGIFPWYSDNDPIMWWSPDPRMILYPADFKMSKSFRQTLRNSNFEVRFDTDFKNVIDKCAKVPRYGEDGTWITDDMKKAYIDLHRIGFAHSVETYRNGKLVGGLYGVSLGRAFFGESMFHSERDASKVALYSLVERVKEWKFRFIDAQIKTDHLQSLGAISISRVDYLNILKEVIKWPTKRGKW